MNLTGWTFVYSVPVIYYCVYPVLLAGLIGWLLRSLHRAGGIFLEESFVGRPDVMQAVRRLLDLGFYLVCLGYAVLTVQTGLPLDTVATLMLVLSWKIGLFLLLLGVMHLFNLLLLAIFRRPPAQAAAVAAQ